MIKIRIAFVIMAISVCFPAHAINIERFEHIDSKQGLSQNNVLTMFCDHMGFMWFGTMDGLNRYDGYQFKVYKSIEGKSNALSNNRISNIWEDSLNFLWVQTYEGYFHYLIPSTEEFITFPNYLNSIEEKNSIINCFYQESSHNIWLGSSNSGAYYLQYNAEKGKYDVKPFISRGLNGISNNHVQFIISDQHANLWIGTNNGLNLLKDRNNIAFVHYFADQQFIGAVKTVNSTYFITKKGVLYTFDQATKQFTKIVDLSLLYHGIEVKKIQTLLNNQLGISTVSNGLVVYDLATGKLNSFTEQGKNIKNIFIDGDKNYWMVTEKFGINKISKNNNIKHYTLTPPELQPLVDDERLFIFEDKDGELWIGTHGAGLALYDKLNDNFVFYKNRPNTPGTLSSNFVHCIAEDQSGLLWVGTGQFNGGINKIVKARSAFKQIQPKKNIEKLSDNVVRYLFEDSNHKIWMTTKSGEIYIYNADLSLAYVQRNIQVENKTFPGYNIYTICEDSKGYIWMGSKGGGVLVSSKPVSTPNFDYNKLNFLLYQNIPNDSASLSSNFVYSIIQDKSEKIWISTYGGGINRVINRTNKKLTCHRLTTDNSNLSSDESRFLFEDDMENIWIGTTFGLNFLSHTEKTKQHPEFTSYLFNPRDKNSISYNDIIHIFQDSKNRIWLGTFGGGLNLIISSKDSLYFRHFTSENGLINDAVFSILEDETGKLWLSTEKGISRFDPETELFDNFDKNNGLFAENFSENTCCRTRFSTMLFGSVNGALVVYPERLVKSEYKPPVVITNFQLSNRNVNFWNAGAPIKQSIETLQSIKLAHDQSSFSFEYAALSYLAPEQNKYSFKLENFDDTWNEVGNQRKATYTNIPPGWYTFKVKAATWDDSWNETPSEISIHILPPWWKSNLAYLIYTLLLIVIVLVSRKILINYYKLHNDLMVERRVNDIKLQFFTNISHEIRTPLTLILGPIEDIKAHKKLPPFILERIDTMERNGKRMLRLVNQLLEFRKIQKSKAVLNIQKTDLISFVKDISEHFTPIARHKKISLNFFSTMENLDVYIDSKKFDSVIFNILSNAFKYSPVGTSIDIEIDQQFEDYVEIKVNDEGPGIPKERQNSLFQRFTSFNTGNDVFEGSGIGLNLSYEIMKLHKGEIIVNSQPNAGSQFIIRLPLGKKHFAEDEIIEVENKQMEKQEIIEEFNFEEVNEEDKIENEVKRRLLIVEDNHEIVIYLKNILNNRFQIKSANNGSEGQEKLEVFHPDLIITDIMMPEMDGIEFSKQVKGNIDTSHIPIIMLTAKSSVEDQITGVESGAESYLLKPFNASLLNAVVNNIIKQRENILLKYSDKKYVENVKLNITAKDDEFMQNIVLLIDKNYQDPEFNVEKLVELSTASRTLLYNKLKGLTGLSPVEFIRQMRLKYAAAILTESGRGVSETAYLTGFNDIKYFRKCFKEMHGLSPKDYKQQIMQERKKES